MTAPVWMQPLIDAAHQSSAWNPVADDLPEDARKSAVLILFGEGSQGPDVLLIERSAHMRSHAGQPAFPGGGVDATDDGPVAAALREAQEETGLDPEGVATYDFELEWDLPELPLPAGTVALHTGSLGLTITGADPDGDGTVTFTVTGIPTGATLSNSAGALTAIHIPTEQEEAAHRPK